MRDLAYFGGARLIKDDVITPWPAPEDSHHLALKSVIKTGKYHRVNHPVVKDFEQKLKTFSGLSNVSAVGSGSAAVHIALDYFSAGRQKGVVSALNWPGAVAGLIHCQIEPVFVDVDLATACMSDEATANQISLNSLVINTHLFGNYSKIDDTRKIARGLDVPVIDDCAQAIGAARQITVCAQEATIAISGNGAKHLGAGELGALCSTHVGVIEHVDRVSLSSSSRNGDRVFSPSTKGYNFRPNVFSAAIAAQRLSGIESQISVRRANALRLATRLSALNGIVPIFNMEDDHNSFCSAAFRFDFDEMDLPWDEHIRDRLVDVLSAEGVPIGVWLRRPVWDFLPSIRVARSLHEFPNTGKLLSSMFYVSEVAPPNDFRVMDEIAAGFEKVWGEIKNIRHFLMQGK
ncbi:DegT/DnrJ/EryC1/StrS family aminotransferase [Paraburkholderia tropica]|uniref:DegT/DnrJ/EryC1/StrS family aminotransferase n=1 Tax=Paraburkholderia tropica TaxID=92647 RepID=UPI002AB7BAF7|nr:DegT/DnrJ/EryC1/StrS family aminotransferase [Paraburkholderia tropica]